MVGLCAVERTNDPCTVKLPHRGAVGDDDVATALSLSSRRSSSWQLR